MKFAITAILVASMLIIATAAVAQPPPHQWSQQFGSTGGDYGYSVAMDASGNVFMTGQFHETVNFGGGSLVSAGLADIVIMKYGATATAVGDTPQSYVLSVSNFPNPFNPSTTITYSTPQAGYVELEIYDLAGRHMSSLVSENVSAGEYQVQWNGKDDAGDQVASGVYLYQLRAGDFVETKRMVLLK